METIKNTIETLLQASLATENTGNDYFSKNHYNDVKNVYVDHDWFETVVYVID